MPDLNANDIEAAMEIVAGTARSMGVTIEGRAPKKEYVITKKLAALLSGKAEEPAAAAAPAASEGEGGAE